MRRSHAFAALSLLFTLAACSGENTAPDAKTNGGARASITGSSGGSCTVKPASEIEANLSLLMSYVTPNDNSALGKFQQVKDALAAHDYALAKQRMTNLINFINLKYGQLSTTQQNTVIPNTGGQTVSQYKDMVIADLICFISFDLNPGDPSRVFTTPDGLAGVWFPPDYVPVGTNVEITNITGNYGPGQSPLITPFDKYPTYVEIKLVPKPAVLNGTPVVVVCFPTNVPSGVAPRLLLGHQRVPNDASGFTMYESVPVPQELADALVCQGGLDIAYTGVQKWLHKAADFLLPEKLHAAFFGLGGVGGSPEEFSPFGAVDPQISVGGAGGSPEEFSKAAPTPVAVKTVPKSANLVIQTASAVGQVGTTSTTGLPSITVHTPGGDDDGVNPVPGVKVTFTLGASTTQNPDGNAHFCEAGGVVPTSVVVYTDATGVATLPCLDFGTIAGFMNLKGTVDGSSLGYSDSDQNSLVIVVSDGSGAVNNEVNFLIQATAGAGTQLTLETAPSATAQAGKAFLQQPTVQLRDVHGNPVPQAGVVVTASIATGAVAVAGGTTATTDAAGLATFTGLRIDGVIGVRTLDFTSGALTKATSGNITIQAGDAAALKMAQEPSSSAQAGVAFAQQPRVQVADAWGNSVSLAGATVTVSLATGAGTLAPAGSLSATTSATGLATFAGLRIDGVTGARTLQFASAPLTGVTSTTTITVSAGAAAKLVMVTQPSSTASAGVAFAQQPSVKLRDQWDNDVTSPQVSVTASITSGGAGTLAGTLTVSTVAGVAAFSGLHIDGVVGSRTLDFASSGLTGITSTSITVGVGAASSIQTWLPIAAPVGAATYNYGTQVEGTAVSEAPRVKVTDAWGNPVDGTAVTWSPLSAANGAVAVVGSGATTAGGGLAQISSWTMGAGANQLNAEILGSTTPAIFTATTPTGQSLFACPVGGSKTDIGWMSIPKPSTAGVIREITLYMSITGQSSTVATYNATMNVYKNSSTGTLMGSGTGGVTLPGNNGSPTVVTFRLSDPITTTELAGTGAAATNTLWFNLTFSNLPGTRKIQVWYDNSITKSNQGPCYESRAYAPGSITTFKRGLGINVTN